jgi:hypothetical protein
MEKISEADDNKIAPVLVAADSASLGEGHTKSIFTRDEYQLAKLGYKQEFFRGLGLFENWYGMTGFTSSNSC